MVTPEKFYGKATSSKSKLIERIELAEKEIKENPVLRTFHSSLFGVSYAWKVFMRQKDALDYREQHSDLMIFTFENRLKLNGSRLFLVCHPDQMWFYQEQKNPNTSAMYELILENSPSKLYFDIEYYLENNPRRSICIVKQFISIVSTLIYSAFEVRYPVSHVIILDSSTSKKFSKHLIFPDLVFVNNYHVGEFVHFLCESVKRANQVDSCPCASGNQFGFYGELLNNQNFNCKSLVVKNCHGKDILICDEGVYTKNRNFRLYLSAKLKKQNPLLLDKQCNYTFSSQKQLFMESLITLNTKETAPIEWKRPCCEEKRSDGKTKNISPMSGSSGPSIFLEIDSLIKSLVQPHGTIRKWCFFPESNSLIYEIANYRYCYNVNREHKSNNIYYVVDLNEKMYYQKCHDPDCSGFRSCYTYLDDNMTKWLDLLTDDDWDAELGLIQESADPQVDGNSSVISGYYDDFGLSSDDLMASDFLA